MEWYQFCRLCPRRCGADRRGSKGRSGFCGETHQMRVAFIGPHFGEEPPISGTNGSGTVFFTGCSLRCPFCQNFQISHEGLGVVIDLGGLVAGIVEMIRVHRVHNVNFVTPDHFFPHVFQGVSELRRNGVDLPLLYNLSGYQDLGMIKAAEDYADIYLPDFKYSDPSLAQKLSKCPDYPATALNAISEMVRQKGFLDSFFTGAEIASKGVLVRHLILPGKVENSITALTSLFVEFGKDLPLSLMSQYHPVQRHEDPDLNRFLLREEFDLVYSHALDLGFEHLFVQFPASGGTGEDIASQFLPDFRREQPFLKCSVDRVGVLC